MASDLGTDGRHSMPEELLLSFLVSATMGCVILCFSLVLIFHNFLLGLLVPLLAATAMKASHWLLARYRPREVDPQHRAIQESIVLGGAISVAIAFALSPHVHLLDLFYAGAATGALAALSIGWEQLWVAWERRAARKADLDAEKARRLAEDGDLVTAQEMLEDALLTTELAFGSHHQQVAKLVTYLAEVMAAQGHVAASTLMYKRSVEVYEQLHPWTHQIVFALDRYAEHLRGQNDIDGAMAVVERSVIVSRQVHGEEAPTALCLLSLARLRAQRGQTGPACKAAGKAASILAEKLGRNHRDAMRARGLFASQCIAQGRLADGQRIVGELLRQRQLQVRQNGYDSDDLDLMLDLVVIHRRSRAPEARQTYAQALDVYRCWVGPTYHRSPELLDSLPSFIASGGLADLAEFVQVLSRGDSFTARQTLRQKPELATQVDATGWTALQWSCFFGQAEVVSTLLSLGADARHGQESGFPPIYIAARWGRHRAVADLIQNSEGLDLDVQGADGSRPIHAAVRSGDQLTFDILLSRKARIDLVDGKGWSPLHEAAFRGHRRFLAALISQGADLNAQAQPLEETPLHAAVKGNSWLTAETLLLNGADLTLCDASGTSPFDLAQQLWHERVVAVMRPHAGKAAESGARS